jgi:hypothetical protein
MVPFLSWLIDWYNASLLWIDIFWDNIWYHLTMIHLHSWPFRFFMRLYVQWSQQIGMTNKSSNTCSARDKRQKSEEEEKRNMKYGLSWWVTASSESAPASPGLDSCGGQRSHGGQNLLKYRPNGMDVDRSKNCIQWSRTLPVEDAQRVTGCLVQLR